MSGYALPQQFHHPELQLVRGEGVYVFDAEGNRYLDAASGVGASILGHAVPEIVEAIRAQAATLAFAYGGLVDNDQRQKLAAQLQEWAPPDMGETRILFCAGGAEANEGALKLAYQFHVERGHPTKRKVVGRWQSYHGNTIATLSMGGRTVARATHQPLLLDFPHIPPPYPYRHPGEDLARAELLAKVVSQEGPEHVAAFIAEPVVGTSMSAVVPDAAYYPRIRAICDDADLLFIADEVICGVGRTGLRFGIEHWQATPDIITLGKGLSAGYSPLAAIILAEHVWRAIAEGSGHSSFGNTFGGNPLSCATGSAVLDIIERDGLVARAGEVGGRLRSALETSLADVDSVGEVRGVGLLLGVELVADRASKAIFAPEQRVAERVVAAAERRGVLLLAGIPGLIDGVGGDHIELLPPYVIEEEHTEEIVEVLPAAILEVMDEVARAKR